MKPFFVVFTLMFASMCAFASQDPINNPASTYNDARVPELVLARMKTAVSKKFPNNTETQLYYLQMEIEAYVDNN